MQNSNVSFVNIPIGDFEDLSLKAVRVLRESQLVICEKLKPARQLLRYINVSFYEGEFVSDNHDLYLFPFPEKAGREELTYLQKTVFPFVQNIAVISDCGSPLFEDPGKKLLLSGLSKAFSFNYVGGITSLSYLMMHAPFAVPFKMYGFLPRETEKRIAELKQIRKRGENVFLMETPYRLKLLCEDLKTIFPDWFIVFGYCLTASEEKIISGQIKTVIGDIQKLPKNEFVLFIGPQKI